MILLFSRAVNNKYTGDCNDVISSEYKDFCDVDDRLGLVRPDFSSSSVYMAGFDGLVQLCLPVLQ